MWPIYTSFTVTGSRASCSRIMNAHGIPDAQLETKCREILKEVLSACSVLCSLLYICSYYHTTSKKKRMM
jgi:hypothetical protein